MSNIHTIQAKKNAAWDTISYIRKKITGAYSDVNVLRAKINGAWVTLNYPILSLSAYQIGASNTSTYPNRVFSNSSTGTKYAKINFRLCGKYSGTYWTHILFTGLGKTLSTNIQANLTGDSSSFNHGDYSPNIDFRLDWYLVKNPENTTFTNAIQAPSNMLAAGNYYTASTGAYGHDYDDTINCGSSDTVLTITQVGIYIRARMICNIPYSADESTRLHGNFELGIVKLNDRNLNFKPCDVSNY